MNTNKLQGLMNNTNQASEIYYDCMKVLNQYLTEPLKAANKLDKNQSVKEYVLKCGYGTLVRMYSKEGEYKLYIHESIVDSDDPIETVKRMIKDGVNVPIQTEPFF